MAAFGLMALTNELPETGFPNLALKHIVTYGAEPFLKVRQPVEEFTTPKTEPLGLSPRANYTERAILAYRKS
jgi:hypothetical protein